MLVNEEKNINEVEDNNQEAVVDNTPLSSEVDENTNRNDKINDQLSETVSEDFKVKEEKDEVEEEEPPLPIDSDFLIEFENYRKKFLKFYKIQRYLQWGVAAIALVIIIFAWVGSALWDFDIWVTISMFAASLVIFVAYSVIMRVILNKKMKKYFVTYYDLTYKYITEGYTYDDFQVDAHKKIENVDFLESDVYQNIVNVGSRALASFKYDDLPIFMCDAAGSVKYEKRLIPVFVGKYFRAPASYDLESKTIIYLKGDARAIPPTKVDDLNVSYEDERMIIYSSDKNYQKFFNTKCKKTFLELKPNKDLIDAFVCLKNGKLYAGLGYDDSLMVLPLQNPIEVRPLKQFKHDIDVMLRLIRLLNK